MTHTATPWQVIESDYALFNLHSDSANEPLEYIGEIIERDDAAFIVKAVNVHDQLLDLLKRVLPFIDDSCDIHEFMADSAATNECRAVVTEARAALAKVQS